MTYTQDLSALHELQEKIKSVRVAMMTTKDETGHLRSRPMATQEMDENGYLWFFTYESSPKVEELERHDSDVNLSYVGDNIYVSVSGKAIVTRDRQKMEELWNPFLKAWFPAGLDEPGIALLRVNVEQAEYWESPGRVVQLIGIIKAAITGEPFKAGENKKLE